MLEYMVLVVSLLATGHVGLSTVFGSSRWDRHNPHSRLACFHREIDDEKDHVVAHNTLPCGTRLWVFNPRTGRSAVARVADRGPRHAAVDLSRQVAKKLGHNGMEYVLLVPLPEDPMELAKAVRAARLLRVADPDPKEGGERVDLPPELQAGTQGEVRPEESEDESR